MRGHGAVMLPRHDARRDATFFMIDARGVVVRYVSMGRVARVFSPVAERDAGGWAMDICSRNLFMINARRVGVRNGGLRRVAHVFQSGGKTRHERVGEGYDGGDGV